MFNNNLNVVCLFALFITIISFIVATVLRFCSVCVCVSMCCVDKTGSHFSSRRFFLSLYMQVSKWEWVRVDVCLRGGEKWNYYYI